MQGLVHRWFVQYNPLYLGSAAFVLAGLSLLSSEASRVGATWGFVAVAAIAEVYAFALIGAAAVLVRRGQRRPAVMLGLLAVCFQADLTLHLETCAFLGTAGDVASVAWLGLFVLKLYALSRALELRPSVSAWAAPTVFAIGLVALPQAFRSLDPTGRTHLVSIFAFTVAALVLWTCRAVESRAGYDPRGRRAVAAVWWIWGAIGLGHHAYWVGHFDVSAAALFAPAALLATRFARGEASVFAWVIGTLAVIGIAAPESFALTALMGGVALALRALRQPVRIAPEAPESLPNAPYRANAPEPAPPTATVVYALAPRAARLRLLLGTAACTHLALWTIDWTGGAWPDHVALLDVALLAGCLVAFHRSRSALALVPAAAVLTHLAIDLSIVTAPRTALGWGIVFLAVGFAVLFAGLAHSLRWAREALHPRSSPPRGRGARAAPVARPSRPS